MKKCTKCGIEKNLDQFSKRLGTKDNLKTECRSCNNLRCKIFLENKENREKARIRSLEFYKKNKEQHILKGKEWYEKNREKVIKSSRQWQKENREKKLHTARIYKKKQRELEKARKLVNADFKKRQRSCHFKVYHAIKKGRLIRPETCEKCNEKKQLHAHHEDYMKPLEVMWLCIKCHHLQHNKRMDIP